MRSKTPDLQECHPASTMPMEEEDAASALEAARHRENASAMVRDHLVNHAANNPGASSDYVTWIATLHPENADVTIDRRFFVPGNPWWTIYEDTKSEEIPSATAIPVKNDATRKSTTMKAEDEEESGFTIRTEDEESGMSGGEESRGSSNEEGEKSRNGDDDARDPHCCLKCNPFAVFFGFVVAVPAVVFALACEMVSLFTCYLPGAACYRIAKLFSPPDCCTCIFYLVFIAVHGVLSFCDSMVLLVSVFGTESVGVVSLLVGFLTGGSLWAKHLHQQIRRVCHGIRVVFRKNTSCGRDPPRRFFCDRTDEEVKPHLKGVKIVRVERVRNPGESYH